MKPQTLYWIQYRIRDETYVLVSFFNDSVSLFTDAFILDYPKFVDLSNQRQLLRWEMKRMGYNWVTENLWLKSDKKSNSNTISAKPFLPITMQGPIFGPVPNPKYPPFFPISKKKIPNLKLKNNGWKQTKIQSQHNSWNCSKKKWQQDILSNKSIKSRTAGSITTPEKMVTFVLGPNKHGLVTYIQVNVYIGNTLSRLNGGWASKLMHVED